MRMMSAVALVALFSCANGTKTAPPSVEARQAAITPDAAAPVSFEMQPELGSVARCPVNGETFTVSKDTVFSLYNGRHYAFCCAGCKAPFDADTARYVR